MLRNQAVPTGVVKEVQLPASVAGMAYHDGILHITADGMLFAAADNGKGLSFPVIDTDFLSIDPQMTHYAVHSKTGRAYYTKPDSKGVSRLYEYYEKKPGKYVVRRVKPAGFSFSIEHPVFSEDGKAMVFSSDCPLGFGGRDLWYSEWLEDKWQYPRNMGHLVNSVGDDIAPEIYGDFLIFSSNGREDGYGGFDLYSSRLVALEQTGDTVMMYPIGRSEVCSLCAPFCSSGDDLLFTVGGRGGWWIRRDSNGAETLNYFSGRLDCVAMHGSVVDKNNSALKDAVIVVNRLSQQKTLLSSDTVRVDSNGAYTLFLQPENSYELCFYAPDHFSYRTNLPVRRLQETELYSYSYFQVSLDAFSLDSIYTFDDLFSSSVSSELSPSGRERMNSIVTFLLENSHLKINVISLYNMSNDAPFCMLLNRSRLRSIEDYLVAKGVNRKAINTSTTQPFGMKNRVENDPMASSAALSSRTVLFILGR
ncbi:MAG: PD40 domain-containing protein [Bacteroidales bacterium]|nr:PD40 domain-containing protein [Bacteroidales bacterium]